MTAELSSKPALGSKHQHASPVSVTAGPAFVLPVSIAKTCIPETTQQAIFTITFQTLAHSCDNAPFVFINLWTLYAKTPGRGGGRSMNIAVCYQVLSDSCSSLFVYSLITHVFLSFYGWFYGQKNLAFAGKTASFQRYVDSFVGEMPYSSNGFSGICCEAISN